MKILQENSSELIIEEKPNQLLTIFFTIWGAMFIGIPLNMLIFVFTSQDNSSESLPVLLLLTFPIIGFTVIFFIFQTHTFTFDKSKHLLIHQCKTFFGTNIKEYLLEDIIRLQVMRYRRKHGYSYNLKLVGLSRNNLTINRMGADSKEETVKIAYILKDFLNISDVDSNF